MYKFYDYISNSSCFVFHKDSKIRKMCITLVEEKKVEPSIDELGGVSDSELAKELNLKSRKQISRANPNPALL